MNTDGQCFIIDAGGGGCLWFGSASSSKRVPKRLIPLSKWENRLHRAKKESEYLFDRHHYRKISGGISQTLAPHDASPSSNTEWWKRFDKFIKLWKIVMTTCAVDKWGAGGVGSVGGGVRPLRVRHASSTFVNYHQDYEIDYDYDYEYRECNDYDDGDAYDHNDNDQSRRDRTSLKSEKDFAALATKLGRGPPPVSEEHKTTDEAVVSIKGTAEVVAEVSLSDMTWYAGVSWEDGWIDIRHPLQQPSDSHDHSRQVWLTPTALSAAVVAVVADVATK